MYYPINIAITKVSEIGNPIQIKEVIHVEIQTDNEKMIRDLLAVKEKNDCFFDNNEEALLRLLEKETVTPEEALLQEILLELNDKMKRVSQLITYMGSKIEHEGILSRDTNGDILLDGIKIPLMQEFEIFLYQEELNRYVWTRTLIRPFAPDGLPRLAGVEKNRDINGIRARMRHASFLS